MTTGFYRRGGLFLDRDGVVNIDRGYVYRPDEIEFIPGIFDLGRAAMRLNLPIMIVTNQSGVARGLYSQRQFGDLMAWMRDRFAAESVAIAHVEHCPWYDAIDVDERWRRDSFWRKPAAGMLLRAAAAANVDPTHSVMIGDRPGDIEAGRAVGVERTVFFAHGVAEGPDHGADHRCDDHQQVIEILENLRRVAK